MASKVTALRPLNTTVAGVRFVDGEAITSNRGALCYFRRHHAYRVEDMPSPRRRAKPTPPPPDPEETPE